MDLARMLYLVLKKLYLRRLLQEVISGTFRLQWDTLANVYISDRFSIFSSVGQIVIHWLQGGNTTEWMLVNWAICTFSDNILYPAGNNIVFWDFCSVVGVVMSILEYDAV
jgi:hypothetical protein